MVSIFVPNLFYWTIEKDNIIIIRSGIEKTTCIKQGFWPPLKSRIQRFLWIVLLDE